MSLNVRSSLISNSASFQKCLVNREINGYYCGIIILYSLLTSWLIPFSYQSPFCFHDTFISQPLTSPEMWKLEYHAVHVIVVKCVRGHNWRGKSRRAYQEVFLWDCFHPRQFSPAVVVAKKSSWSRWEGALLGSSPSLSCSSPLKQYNMLHIMLQLLWITAKLSFVLCLQMSLEQPC